MKQSKIFNWLYFIILLLPIMLVFIPMINNYQPSVKNEIVETVEYGVNSYKFKDWPYFESVMPNNIERPSFALNLKTSGFIEIFKKFQTDDNLSDYVGIMFLSTSSWDYLTTYFYEWDTALDGWYSLENFSVNYYYDYENYVLHIDQQFVMNDINKLYFSPVCYCIEDDTYCTGFLPFYYKDYVVKTEYNSILYDFSLKMNDSFLVVGDLTEWVSDNIIDLSTNDYVFFAWTYSIYIFVVSLLWLLVSFLLFIIKFANRWLNGIYEKW